MGNLFRSAVSFHQDLFRFLLQEFLIIAFKFTFSSDESRGNGIYIDFRGKLQRQAVSQAYQRCLRGIIIQSHWIIGIDAIG